MSIAENIRNTIRAWLEIDELQEFRVKVNNGLGFEANAIKNKIWYRGDANELEQLYKSLKNARKTDSLKFWGASSTTGLEIQKRTTGLAGLMVDMLADITLADFNGVEFGRDNETLAKEWAEVYEDNNLEDVIEEAVKQALYIGDGAFKVSLDPTISDKPIIEFWGGDKIDIVTKRGRLREIIFKSEYTEKGNKYEFREIYGFGYIKYELYKDRVQIDDISIIPALKDLAEIEFDDSYMMAVLMKYGRSDRWEGRGQSIYDRKIDSFDSFDEIWSQWCDAIRAGRTKEYIPDDLIPRKEDGTLMKPNPFDNRFIKVGMDMSENGKNSITIDTPIIQHESYLASYITALDLCLQGIISPSTLGIDVKKLDNAEAQREKEKATLYTRQKIVGVLSKTIPELVQMVFNVMADLQQKPLQQIKTDLKFGEYANPSFESQVETVGKARTNGIMSVETSIEELYGDSKDDGWKKAEVARIKSEQGIVEVEEVSLEQDLYNWEKSLSNER